MSTLYNPKLTTSGLVLYLDAANIRSYSGSGATWNDLSGNNNACTLVNTPTYSTENNGAIVFDGTTQYGQISSISGITDFSRTDAYTVNFWMYLNSVQNNTTNTDNDVVEKWSGTGGYPYTFRLDRATNLFSVNVWNGSAANGTTITVTRNTWWNVCGVFNWPGSLLTLYGNGGQLISTATLNLTGTISNSSPLFLMQRGQSGANNRATGRVAALSIYNRALSAQEVLQNFNATRSRFGV